MIMITLSQLTAVFLVAIRIGVVLIFTPIHAIRHLPIRIRLLFILALSAFLVCHLSLSVKSSNEIDFIINALVELANGLILSVGLYAVFAVFHIAGQLIDTQMGLNSLAIFNPADHSYDPLTSRLLTLLATLFFFSLDGHHRLVQGFAYSFTIIPPGKFAFFNEFNRLIKQFSFLFTLSWMIASPILIGLLLIELSCAILTRNMPQLNTHFLALPIKLLLGFFLLGLLLNSLNPLMDQLFKFYFQNLYEVRA